MPRILLLSIFCFFLFGCEEEGGGLIERETDSSPSSSSENSGSGDDSSGSGDSDGSTIKSEFSITPYRNANVSTDSMVGTWVAVGSGTDTYTEDGKTYIDENNELIVFTTTQNGNRIANTRCVGELAAMSIDGNKMSLSDNGSGVALGNRYVEIDYNRIDELEGSYRQVLKYNYKLAKVSDETNNFGSLNINYANKDDMESGVNCFRIDNDSSIHNGKTYYSMDIYMAGGENVTIYDIQDDDPDIDIGNDNFSSDATYSFTEREDHSIKIIFSGTSQEGGDNESAEGRFSITIPN